MTLVKNLTRALTSLAANNGQPGAAHATAVARWGDTSAPAKITKAWTTLDLSDEEVSAAKELLQMVNRGSLIGLIGDVQNFRRISFNQPILEITTGATAGFIAVGASIPAASFSATPLRLPVRKVGGILPASAEAAKMFNLDASLALDLARAIAEAESLAFFSDAAGTADTPPGILYDISAASASSTGTPGDDIDALLENFEGDLSRSAVLTSPQNGLRLFKAGFLNTGCRGGDLAGLAHVTHHAIPEDAIAVVDVPRVLLADEGTVRIDMTSQATLTVTNEDNTTEEISLFQNDAVAWRIIREINWRPAAGAVAWLDGVSW